MSTYLIRDIPGDFWQRVKIQAATERITIRKMIFEQLEQRCAPKAAEPRKTKKEGK